MGEGEEDVDVEQLEALLGLRAELLEKLQRVNHVELVALCQDQHTIQLVYGRVEVAGSGPGELLLNLVVRGPEKVAE